MEQVRVLIVEDELLFRDLLAQTLTSGPGYEIVGLADTGREAIELAHKTRPDAVIMDIGLADDMDGIEAAVRIKDERPQTGIVILSAHNDRRYVTSLPLGHMAGWAYLLKQTAGSAATVVRAVETSIEGGLMVDPSVISRLRPRLNSRLSRLTPRVYETLTLLAQGYNNQAIATRMVISVRAVEDNINVLYSELGLRDEPEINARVAATLIFLEESQNTPEDENGGRGSRAGNSK